MTNGSLVGSKVLDRFEPGIRIAIQIAAIFIGAAILAISAKVQVPFWPVPMTLQTFVLFAISAAYGMRLAVATVLAYFAEGLVGLPVFAGAAAGPAYFAGPTAGFLAGFLAVAVIVGAAADRGWSRSAFRLFGAMLAADIILFALGFLWLGFMFISPRSGATLGAATAFAAGVQPFVLADLVKITLAACLVPALWRLSPSDKG